MKYTFHNDNGRLIRKDEEGNPTGSYTRQFLENQLQAIEAGNSNNKEAELAEVTELLQQCDLLNVVY